MKGTSNIQLIFVCNLYSLNTGILDSALVKTMVFVFDAIKITQVAPAVNT